MLYHELKIKLKFIISLLKASKYPKKYQMFRPLVLVITFLPYDVKTQCLRCLVLISVKEFSIYAIYMYVFIYIVTKSIIFRPAVCSDHVTFWSSDAITQMYKMSGFYADLEFLIFCLINLKIFICNVSKSIIILISSSFSNLVYL